MTLFKIRAVTCGKNLLKLAVSASRTMLVWGLYLLNIAVEVVGVCESPEKKSYYRSALGDDGVCADAIFHRLFPLWLHGYNFAHCSTEESFGGTHGFF